MDDVKLSELFCETEDLKYVDMMSEETKKLLTESLEKSISELRRNKIEAFDRINLGLSMLMLNRMRRSSTEDIRIINCTPRIVIYSNLKIKVLIIEDLHILKCPFNSKSISIEYYLDNLIKNATDYVDLFIEIGTDKQGAIPTYTSNHTLYTVGRAFSELNWDVPLKNSKIYRSIPYLRVHRTDYRTMYPELDNFCRGMAGLIFNKTPIKIDYLERIKNKLLSIDYFRNYILEILSMDKKIKKQIDNIHNPLMKQRLQYLKNKWLYNSETCINSSILSYEKIINILGEDDTKKKKELYLTFCGYFGVLMDVYTIARMFRTYRKVDNRYSGPAKQIIYLAGNLHTRRLETFLNICNFDKIFDTGYNPDNYVDMNNYDFKL